jgi:hypothetical protein
MREAFMAMTKNSQNVIKFTIAKPEKQGMRGLCAWARRHIIVQPGVNWFVDIGQSAIYLPATLVPYEILIPSLLPGSLQAWPSSCYAD